MFDLTKVWDWIYDFFTNPKNNADFKFKVDLLKARLEIRDHHGHTY